MSEIKDNRNYGIDLIKILSMFLVCVLHVLGQGGILNTAPKTSTEYWLAWLFETAAYCAVDCFALASGFLMVGKSFKYRRILPLYATVLFYSVVITAVGFFVSPEFVEKSHVLYPFPVSTNKFWYFTSYFCTFFFIPFLNTLTEKLEKRKFLILLLTGFILFSGVRFVGYKADPFSLSSGYTPWWLMYLYLLGAGIKKYELWKNVSPALALSGYISSVGISWILKMAFAGLIKSDTELVKLFFTTVGENRFINYLSPTILMSAVCLLLFCTRVKIPKILNKPLKFLSVLNFQVYIIHVHPVIWKGLLKNHFIDYATESPVILVLVISGGAAAIYGACIIIDYIRYLLFKLLRVDRNINKICDKLSLFFEKKLKTSKNFGWILPEPIYVSDIEQTESE